MTEGRIFTLNSDTVKNCQLRKLHIANFAIETLSFYAARKMQFLSILQSEMSQNVLF